MDVNYLHTIILLFCSFDTGGTFALYSLLCRHTKLSHVRNRQEVDEFSTHNLELTSKTRRKHPIIHFLEEHKLVHDVLIGIVLFGTCMVIGDGILTPPMSGERSHLIAICEITVLKWPVLCNGND
jgi:KUP system potassium uptake protein